MLYSIQELQIKKMKNFFKIFYFFTIILIVKCNYNYCDPKLCKMYDDQGAEYFENHIACGHTGVS